TLEGEMQRFGIAFDILKLDSLEVGQSRAQLDIGFAILLCDGEVAQMDLGDVVEHLEGALAHEGRGGTGRLAGRYGQRQAHGPGQFSHGTHEELLGRGSPTPCTRPAGKVDGRRWGHPFVLEVPPDYARP